MKKAVYIELMEKVFEAYSYAEIEDYIAQVRKRGLEEHGFPRLACNLGILIAHGRKSEYTDLFISMMNLCCDEMGTAMSRNGATVGNEFSVKEMVHCLIEVEEAGIISKEITDVWRKKLADMKPAQIYDNIAPIPPVKMGNWAAFAGDSEQLRIFAGMSEEKAFVDNQVKSQLFSFDEKGMYRDPNEPMVYDFVTRLQLAEALYFGFDGESRKELEENLIKSSDITLKMQSVTGEMPYGGRSNQFLHNETVYAALCEFYADFFNKRGDTDRARRFKAAARFAVDSIRPWLAGETIYHVKNFYDRRSKFGCEDYAYFNKYMITASSWLYLAYAMADDSIEESLCPAESGESYTFCTSEHFHKVFCTKGEYHAEFDTCADYHYDASGLGRVQRRGAPPAICLSTPFSEEPTYSIGENKNPSPLAICGGIVTENGVEYTCISGSEYVLSESEEKAGKVTVSFDCRTVSGKKLRQLCSVSDEGVELEVRGEGEIEILFPMFSFDGKTSAEISISGKKAEVVYKGYICKYSTDGIIEDKNSKYWNRNGEYRAAAAKGKSSIKLKIEIDRVK